ncbi:hypothetical protein OE88DRAFT_1736071 [Heliocybe sulcata]|uniref:Uncharacterized protein n=1 Tax=Heliocybe sulcata TaxID=5364 RepID=A0A5C3MYX5_9AGAM|nr:hypothetical protein OE88DRAFT_1736071 [Heliocybe sulcata]
MSMDEHIKKLRAQIDGGPESGLGGSNQDQPTGASTSGTWGSLKNELDDFWTCYAPQETSQWSNEDLAMYGVNSDGTIFHQAAQGYGVEMTDESARIGTLAGNLSSLQLDIDAMYEEAFGPSSTPSQVAHPMVSNASSQSWTYIDSVYQEVFGPSVIPSQLAPSPERSVPSPVLNYIDSIYEEIFGTSNNPDQVASFPVPVAPSPSSSAPSPLSSATSRSPRRSRIKSDCLRSENDLSRASSSSSISLESAEDRTGRKRKRKHRHAHTTVPYTKSKEIKHNPMPSLVPQSSVTRSPLSAGLPQYEWSFEEGCFLRIG